MADSDLSRKMVAGDRPPIGMAVLLGTIVLILFFGVFAGWAGLAPLQSAAIATGAVSLDTNRKSIQHLEGGIIRALQVREGDKVRKDQILIELDDTQAKARIALLQAQINSVTEQLRLIRDEIKDVNQLLKKGLARKPRLLALLRRQAELEGERIKHEAEMRAARYIIGRSTIRAPLAGTIVNLMVHTRGGVIKAGDTLMSIVPKDEPLVIEARLDPNDIDVVHAGLSAQVRLTPFSARSIPPLVGRVDWISADRMSDKRTGANYYLARISLAKRPSELIRDIQLYPGMPAEVMIATGSRTMLEYFAAPIYRSFRRAFREQ